MELIRRETRARNHFLKACLENLSVTDGLMQKETSCLSVTPQTPDGGSENMGYHEFQGASVASITDTQRGLLGEPDCLLKCRHLLNLNHCQHRQRICI